MRLLQSVLFLIATGLPAFASDGFDIVIPGRAGVPIIINGVDASYSVVEGEYGLLHGNPLHPTVYGGRYVDPVPNVGHYYPGASEMPGYGRLEVEPPADRTLPKPAASFHQTWSAQSTPQVPQPPAAVPFYPPPIIQGQPYGGMGAPQNNPGPHRPRH